MSLPPITPYVADLPYPLQDFLRQVRAALSGQAGFGTISSTAVQGVGNGSNATAGYIGEYQESVIAQGSAVSMTDTTPKTITSLSLSSGDWDVWGIVRLNAGNAGGVLILIGGIGTTTNTLPSERNSTLFALNNFAGSFIGYTVPTPTIRFNLNTSTTLYLIGSIANGAVESGYGELMARRVR